MVDPLSASVTFRCTPAEKEALEALARARAAEMAERGDIPDDTMNGYLRAVIRKEAKARGIPVDAPVAPAPAAKKASKKRSGR